MPYSLVGGPALGFDLTRLAGGRQVAEVLRTALAVGPDELERLASRHPGARARAAWAPACDPAERDSGTLGAVLPYAGRALEEAAAGETGLLRRLESGLLGDSSALDRLVRHDVLDWTWLQSGPLMVQDPVASEAADVLVDAAVSSYLRDRLATEVRRAMAAPYALARVPARDETVPTGVVEVDRVLDVLARADEEVRDTWRRVVEGLRAHTGRWAPAMHQATWAMSLSGRLRLACDVQLAGVMAFGRAGFTPHDAAYGLWNALAGVLGACAVADLLPAADAAVLLRPWHEVYGGPI